MTVALAALTITVVGLMVGVELAVAAVLNPIIHGLAVGPSLEAGAHGGRMLGRLMPVWYITSLALTAGLAAATGGAGGALSLTAAALLAVSVVLSVAVLVPIRTSTWTADSHPDDWREQRRRWDGFHLARVVLVVGAFALVATTATLL
ncbi:MAG TPA: anthrone oxygenase family protein [Actinotalea caeni]|uniref:anthrone oxygenase family protein n=1 Tax=Actinotalea caeni TaxID=1348467 RepID=UPI002B4AC97A|nr:anthrone oxygenase family protein [Actinotalea caeni]HLV55650.1 anthrone oxygenase family protein [Actinotalea caeni]